MQRILFIAALLFSGAVACGTDPSNPPPEDPSVYVAGVIRDEDGMPVPFALATWEAWPAPDSVEGQAAGTSGSVRWQQRSDSLGRFAAHLGYYSITQLDSLEVVANTDDCWGYEYSPVRDRLIPLSAAAPDTVFNRVLRLARTASRARLTVGAACAVIIVDDVPEMENRFGLWIDEIGDSIRGRWRINYGWSRGDDIGQFSGWRSENSVVLELQLDTTYETPLGLCTGYTLEIPLEAGDTLGPGSYSSESCPFDSTPLRFTEGESLDWLGTKTAGELAGDRRGPGELLSESS